MFNIRYTVATGLQVGKVRKTFPTFIFGSLYVANNLENRKKMSIPESASSTTDFVIVGRLPVLNMFNISTPIQSANSSRPTIADSTTDCVIVGRLPVLNMFNTNL